MNPKTRVRSAVMGYLSSARYVNFEHTVARLARPIFRRPKAVYYFHQVDDPYSHLAVQKLGTLEAAYDLPFIPHLVSKPAAEYQGSSEHFDAWALRDAVSVAQDYEATFPDISTPSPGPRAVHAANGRLAAHLERPDFADVALATGNALWCDGLLPDDDKAKQASERATAEGDALRTTLGHYLGGMFYFEGEWFWGVDRIRLLERRLIEGGFARAPALGCVPQPTPTDTSGLNADHIVLEYFPSLRSPYTAVGHQRVLDLIARSGVRVKVRPVMPMLMRGIPAPWAKQKYIIMDAGREARAHNVPFGRIVDPFGEPVKRAFALFAGASALNRGMDFVTAYLSAAWAEGIDITTGAGLRQVADRADIDWRELQRASTGSQWEALLDDNLTDMLAAGLWGVPSFRVTGGNRNNDAPYACWGQDRIWRVENEIARRA